MKMGTRTQVAVSLIFGSRIFLVSATIFTLLRLLAILHEHVDMGMTLKAIRLVKRWVSIGVRDVDRAGLAEELIHGVLAGAGDGLVGRHHHALDLATSCGSASARPRAAAVEQLGLAMMLRLRKPMIASAFHLGTISGTSES